MNTIKNSIVAILILFAAVVQAQDVDEIISNYFENTGGYEAWGELKGIKIMAKVNQGGMEIPLEIVQMADGRQYTKVNVQGNELKQQVFDGETVWSTNFQTGKAEKADDETIANMKLQANDFPDAFYNYKEKGYEVELVGTETIEGTEAFKIKLTKEPIMVDGEETEDVSYYFFDKEAFIPIAQESAIPSGPAKGSIQQITMSDYQEVEGLYFPFAMTQGVKDGASQPIEIESIEVNPNIDEGEFDFPESE